MSSTRLYGVNYRSSTASTMGLITSPIIRGYTHDSRPMISHRSCPSFRRSLLIWPAQLIICTPCIHSSTVMSFSRAKSWICLIRLPKTCLMRGLALGPMELTTLSVKLGSYLGFTPPSILAASGDVIRGR